MTTTLTKNFRKYCQVFSAVGTMVLGGIPQANATGGTYDLVQILSDQRVREIINLAEIGLVKKLGPSTYQINFGKCAMVASIAEECTEQPGPPSCDLRVKFNPAGVHCQP